MKKKALILANGSPPSRNLLTRFLKDIDLFICADGGANTAARFGLTPDLIIGDLDSITPNTRRKLSRVQTKRIVSQNSTDLEKAISWAARNSVSEVIVLAATGKRLDHAIGNLSALAKFSRKLNVRFVDDESELLYVGRSFRSEFNVGTVVSLIPLSGCRGIVTKGLKWELRNESLMLGRRESTSNVVKWSPVRIKVRNGDLLLYVVNRPASTAH